MAALYDRVYQFRIELRHIKPAIWRRLQVPGDYSFWDLHVALQDAMGWNGYHLHSFEVTNPATLRRDTIGIPDETAIEEMGTMQGWHIAMGLYLTLDHPQAEYLYDFGDGWMHTLALEGILRRETGVRYPRCLGGERACPPEDCGGIGGYAHLLQVLADPEHEEHDTMLAWLGGPFDSEAFDLDAVRFGSPKKRWRTYFLE